VSAQSGPAEFVPFRNFIDQTATANADNYLGQPASKVKDAAAFEEMRQHILNMYQGVDVNHSFVLDSAHYDCVPTMQQPAVRKYGIKKLASPPDSVPAKASDSNIDLTSSLDHENQFDAFGNSTHCEDDTIPMRRITLETMTRFQTLQQFFQKSPAEQAPQQEGKLGPGAAHKYSYAYQWVNNLGGNSNLNIWSPYVNTSLGEVFSLSQEWYVGGSGSGTQTEEVGWVVYPAMFGDEYSHFFIFSTPDDYNTGCWNNSCGDFVQTKDAGLLGARFNPTSSTLGRQQIEFSSEYQLYKGNWWVSYNGTFFGYYPGSMYKGGQNTKHAQLIEYGTEGVGTTVWPPEGSGDWPSKGWEYAAYQRDIFYINTAGKGVWASLTPDIPSPNCYSIGGPFSGSGDWTVYFYEGGPGGKNC